MQSWSGLLNLGVFTLGYWLETIATSRPSGNKTMHPGPWLSQVRSGQVTYGTSMRNPKVRTCAGEGGWTAQDGACRGIWLHLLRCMPAALDRVPEPLRHDE